MSITETTTEHDAHEFSEHMSDWQYVKIALLLGLLTGIEVLTYFVDFGPMAVPTLIALMIVKFAVVVAYFMHLRFDNSLFTKLFVAGLLLAIGVYITVFLTFAFWTGWLE